MVEVGTDSSNTAMPSQILCFDTLWSPGYNGELIRNFHIGHFPCNESCNENVMKIHYKIHYIDLCLHRQYFRMIPLAGLHFGGMRRASATQFVEILCLVLSRLPAKTEFADFCGSVCQSTKTARLKI